VTQAEIGVFWQDNCEETPMKEYEQPAAYNIAYINAFRGEPDPAFEWLDRAVRYRDAGLSHIMINPLFANIHNNPRWQPLLKRIGKSPMQLDAIKFKVQIPALIK
jgi:hypothetical protein